MKKKCIFFLPMNSEVSISDISRLYEELGKLGIRIEKEKGLSTIACELVFSIEIEGKSMWKKVEVLNVNKHVFYTLDTESVLAVIKKELELTTELFEAIVNS